jgi:hypothetical protein
MIFTRRRVALAAAATLVAVTIVGAAFATRHDDEPSAQRAAGHRWRRTSASTRVGTPTSTPPGSTTSSALPTTAAPVGPESPETTLALPASGALPGSGTTVTTAAPSPWPAGTILGSSTLTAHVTFDPNIAILDNPIAYTATITNPNDQWLFYDFTPVDNSEIAYVGLEVGWNANGLYVVAQQSDPVFQHQTAQGPRTGLLLAPHATQTFTGHIQGYSELGYDDPGPNGTRYFPVSVVFKDECCIGYGGIPAGELPIPSPTTTTPAGG